MKEMAREAAVFKGQKELSLYEQESDGTGG